MPPQSKSAPPPVGLSSLTIHPPRVQGVMRLPNGLPMQVKTSGSTLTT